MKKKITLATVKKFVRENYDNLYISSRSSFDGMTDCVQSSPDHLKEFHPIRKEEHSEPTLGIVGAWFVRGSRDWFEHYEDEQFIGIDVSNCCGHFILAVKK